MRVPSIVAIVLVAGCASGGGPGGAGGGGSGGGGGGSGGSGGAGGTAGSGGTGGAEAAACEADPRCELVGGEPTCEAGWGWRHDQDFTGCGRLRGYTVTCGGVVCADVPDSTCTRLITNPRGNGDEERLTCTWRHYPGTSDLSATHRSFFRLVAGGCWEENTNVFAEDTFGYCSCDGCCGPSASETVCDCREAC